MALENKVNISFEDTFIKTKLKTNRQKINDIIKHIKLDGDILLSAESYGSLDGNDYSGGWNGGTIIKFDGDEILTKDGNPSELNMNVYTTKGYSFFEANLYGKSDEKYICINFDFNTPCEFHEQEKIAKKTFTNQWRPHAQTNTVFQFENNEKNRKITDYIKENPEVMFEIIKGTLIRQFEAYEEMRAFRTSEDYINTIKDKHNENSMKIKYDKQLKNFKNGVTNSKESVEDVKAKISSNKSKLMWLAKFGFEWTKAYTNAQDDLLGLENCLPEREKILKSQNNYLSNTQKQMNEFIGDSAKMTKNYQDVTIKHEYVEFKIVDMVF